MVDIVTLILITITAIAAVSPFIIYFYQRQRKTLAYEILSVSPLLTGNELAGRVTINFDNWRVVQNIYILIIKLINSGNIPIISTDFEKPIVITFDRQNEILSAEVTEKNPSNLDPKLTVTQDGVELSPLLLNNGDYIIFKTLLTSCIGDIQVSGRIVGVNNIQKVKEPTFPFNLAIAGMILTLTGLLLTLFVNLLWFVIVTIGYFMLLYAIGKRKKFLRKKQRQKAQIDNMQKIQE